MTELLNSIPSWVGNAATISVTVSSSVLFAAFKVTRYLTSIETRMDARMGVLEKKVDAIQEDAKYVRDKVVYLEGAFQVHK